MGHKETNLSMKKSFIYSALAVMAIDVLHFLLDLQKFARKSFEWWDDAALMEENRLLRQQLRRNGITPCTEQEGAKIIAMRTVKKSYLPKNGKIK